jgi:hypothetical protein
VVGPEERRAYWVNTTELARRHRLLFTEECRRIRYMVYGVCSVTPAVVAQWRTEDATRSDIELGTVEPESVRQFGTLRIDENFEQGVLRLGDRAFNTGLGTHAPSDIRYHLEGAYTAFTTVIGIDDSQRNGPGSVVFRVEVDGREVYSSGLMTAASPPRDVKVDLTGATTLRLVVDDGGDGNRCDHADWAGATLTRKR